MTTLRLHPTPTTPAAEPAPRRSWWAELVARWRGEDPAWEAAYAQHGGLRVLWATHDDQLRKQAARRREKSNERITRERHVTTQPLHSAAGRGVDQAMRQLRETLP